MLNGVKEKTYKFLVNEFLNNRNDARNRKDN